MRDAYAQRLGVILFVIYVLALPVILLIGLIIFVTYNKMKSDQNKGKEL